MPPKRLTEAAARLEKFRHEGQDGGPDPASTSSHQLDVSQPATATTEDIDRILAAVAAIQGTLTTITTGIEVVKTDVALLRQDFRNLRERVAETETRISTVEDTLIPVSRSIERTEMEVKQLKSRAEDQENRQRRSNVRVVGLPEKVEGSKPETFAEQLLISLFGRESFSTVFIIERAHRISMRVPPPGAPPRTFIMKFLNYRDRDATLNAARNKGQIQYENSTISFYPDFSLEVQKKRSHFASAKRKLQELQIKYAMLYPAKLKVMEGNRSTFFQNPEDLHRWLDERGRRRRPSPPAD